MGYNEIKKELNFGNLKKAVFGAYDANERGEGSALNISEIDVLNHLNAKYYILDWDDILEGNEGIETYYETNYDFIYENDFLEIGENWNSYNWGSSAIFHYQYFEMLGIKYVAIRFHRYGDVRGNYTDFALIKLESDYESEFLETLMDLRREVSFDDISITYNVTKEGGCFDIYSEEKNINIYDQYIDCDDTNEKDIIEKVKEYLKENNYEI